MPSDAFIGMLSGLGDAHRARQKNIFDQEVARREQMAKTFEKLAEHPSITPEGAEQYYKQAFGIRTLDINKKVPKEWESLATEVAPKFGQSWLGGQTTNKVEAQNQPIASTLDRALPQSLPVGQLDDGSGGSIPVGLPAEPSQVQRQTPPPSQYEAPMPQPPPGATRSAFYSPQELSKQKMQAAIEMLQALGPIQRQQELEAKRAELPLQVELDRARQQAQQEFAPVPAPKGYGSSPVGIYSQDTGEVIHPGKLSLEEQAAAAWLAQNPGKTPNDYQTMDANRRKQNAPLPVVINTGSGPQLVNRATGEASPVTNDGSAIGPAPTADQRNRDTAMKRVDPVLASIAELSEKINTGKGLLAKLSGGVERAKAQANYNDDVAEYMSLIAGFTPMVARAVGHTGVLTQQDVDSVRELFPKPGDSKTLRDRKIARVKTILSGAPTASPSSAGGAGKISVTAPDGSVHPFDTQAQADAFKRLAGIK